MADEEEHYVTSKSDVSKPESRDNNTISSSSLSNVPEIEDSNEPAQSEPPIDNEHEQNEGLTPMRRSLRKHACSPQKITCTQVSERPAQQTRKAITKRKQPLRGNWSADYLLSNPKSKLTTINLQAWASLSREQQLHLIRMLPGMSSFDADGELPNLLGDKLKHDTSFQADVRLFKEDLEAGRYDPVWLKDAENAMQKRAKGNFDDWKEDNREKFWGQKQRVDWMALAGESSEHNLATLVKAKCFEIGDIWVLRRAWKKSADETIVVEKEAKIIDISPSHELTFTFPPGQHKFSAIANGEDKIVDRINGPRPLSKAILAEDGRIVGVRDANAWREFRCFRKNQDIGSLFDVRELYHQRQQRQNSNKP